MPIDCLHQHWRCAGGVIRISVVSRRDGVQAGNERCSGQRGCSAAAEGAAAKLQGSIRIVKGHGAGRRVGRDGGCERHRTSGGRRIRT